MPPPRLSLPIDAVLDDVVAALRRGPAVVLQAPPGAGKTTRVPLALLDAGLVMPGQQLLLLEPRRVAARAAASTMAVSVGDGVGGTVGYQVRFDKRASAQTKILVVTEGILTRRFADDALLEGVGVVILDEFHERSVHTDLCLALVRELQHVRDDLKLIVMSATLDAGAVASYLHDCPVVTSAGRPFPVAIRHAERGSSFHHLAAMKSRDGDRPLDERVAGAIRTLMATTEPGFADDGGDVLCFLPGAPEIERVRKRLSERALPGDADVVALFGAMSPAEQDRALLRGLRRKVILSTNVAETSLTIEGVTGVVDSGLQKTVRWDSGSDRERLELASISKASAEQRAGRAGRTRPGRALRLWSEAEHAQLLPSHAPEIHRVELSGVLLDIAVFSGEDPRRFAFFEPPPKAHLDHAVEVLQLLGALDATGRPTARGKALARLPLSPRAAAVMLAARDLDVVDDAAWAMALLEDDRALSAVMERKASTTTDSDLQEHIARAEHDRRLSELRQSVKALTGLVGAPVRATNDEGPGRRLKRALLAGFPDRLCRRRKAGATEALMVGGRGVKLLPESGVDAGLFLALSLEGRGAAAGVAIAEAVDEALLKDAAPGLLSTMTEAVLDEARGAFVGVRRTRFADLIIDERDGVAVDDDAVARGLAAAFAERFGRLFAPDDATQSLLERLRFAHLALPDDGFPAVDDDALKGLLPDLCHELVRRGRRRLEDVAAADWRGAIAGLLDWPHQQLLDAEVPAKLTVPTGNALRVDYAPALQGAAPVLAVRLQECFGWLDTPRVARGRVAVVLHLLSPGYKPVQVTTDLRSFWQRGYKEVRAELRARYPKHSWPDDPLSAAPVAKGRSSR
jgi:ATP-dependent helicase HrpB